MNSTLPPFDKLEKVLVLEKDLGYTDRAVIGGLGKFAAFWHEEAKQNTNDPFLVRLIDDTARLLVKYSDESLERRRQIVEEILREWGAAEAEPRPERSVPAETAAVQPPTETEPSETRTTLASSVRELHGVSDAYAKRLSRLGVTTIRDLLYLFPNRYDDFSSLKTIDQLHYGEEVTVVGTVRETRERTSRRGQSIVSSTISDGTATVEATWFNQPYLVKRLTPGKQIVISGKVDQYLGRLTFSSPTWEPLDKELIHTGRIVPVYPLTKGITGRWLRRLMKRTTDYWSLRLPDHLPLPIREKRNLLDLENAIRQIHFPDDSEVLEQARRRLAFDELLMIQLGVLKQRHQWRQRSGQPVRIDSSILRTFVDSLPFPLTSAQERSLSEILDDLQRPEPMSRLLQGDVGSGKTVVAAAAMLMTAASNMQAVLMAPTEILAEQHHVSLGRLWGELWLPGLTKVTSHLRLLTGSAKQSEKERIYEEIASGEARIIVGTHALIQEGVEFDNLGLVVIDEQHRFGVTQRATLRQKGHNPHVLVMSATPIPRTLALTIYGDLDISTIDELPPGRKEIITRWMKPRERERAYSFLHSRVEESEQAFIICPLIEESEKIEAKAAVEEHRRLRDEVFPDLRLGLLHGRMTSEEKEAAMRDFYRGELDILVCTPVVEVGIDVPNATVMLIEGADRFGLAQLHQFRGRVGRGERQSYCLLVADSPTDTGEQRLQIIESTQDGFKLADEDLAMRGPGEFFGTRQSGLPDLKVARLSDVSVLEEARAVAKEIWEKDPELESPQNRLLARRVGEFWQREEGDLS
ncbi:MAG: ATP-dependent DNA helicase RecG [Anaerolineae bacterium]|nr:ATP-dependent DNA helicase RecG [Anaerolineae bacterium]NIN94066.1 ATP-dependent DNA helicase RecG [Anaerolineae bacterium]NIQ77107.1 ATP-dependent DNA helicase RecG [Anaerolineae bacterium]